jgi:hypothetical protein
MKLKRFNIIPNMKLVRFWRNIAGMDIAWHGYMSMGQNNQLYTQIE